MLFRKTSDHFTANNQNRHQGRKGLSDDQPRKSQPTVAKPTGQLSKTAVQSNKTTSVKRWDANQLVFRPTFPSKTVSWTVVERARKEGKKKKRKRKKRKKEEKEKTSTKRSVVNNGVFIRNCASWKPPPFFWVSIEIYEQPVLNRVVLAFFEQIGPVHGPRVRRPRINRHRAIVRIRRMDSRSLIRDA